MALLSLKKIKEIQAVAELYTKYEIARLEKLKNGKEYIVNKTLAEHARAYRLRKAERMKNYQSALESIAQPFPAQCSWEDQARACQIVARQALGLSA